MSAIRITEQQLYLLLSAPDAMHNLAHNEATAVELVKKLTPKHQVAVLSAPFAVSRLAYGGQGAAVVEIVKGMSPKNRVTVLSAQDAVWGLANNGQGAVVVEMAKGMTRKDRVTVLFADNAISGLANNGQALAVDAAFGKSRLSSARPLRPKPAAKLTTSEARPPEAAVKPQHKSRGFKL